MIDSVLVGGVYHKQFWISTDSNVCCLNTNYVSLIEGVGTTFGLFGLMGGDIAPTFEAGSSLLCQSINNSQQYPSDGGISVCTPLTVGITENKIVKAELFPNPATGILNVSSEIKLSSVEIYNVLGSLVYRLEINKDTAELNIAELPSDIYFVRLHDIKGNSVTKKIVKQ